MRERHSYRVRWFEWNGEEYVPESAEFKSEANAEAYFDGIKLTDDIPQVELLVDGEQKFFKDFFFDDEHAFGL